MRTSYALLTLFVSFLINDNSLFAQKEASVWYFGDGAGLSFAAGQPRVLSDGNIFAPEGAAVINDGANGDLLCYSDGRTVWGSDHNELPGGTGLLGGRSSYTAALFVPVPGKPSRFYLFTTSDWENHQRDPSGNGLHYSIVDLSANGGRGAVEVNSKNTLLLPTAVEGMAATLDCNGRDYWLVSHAFAGARFYAWRITEQGLAGSPIVSEAGPSISNTDPEYVVAALRFSPDGRRIALMTRSHTTLLRFDIKSGIVSNPVPLAISASERDCLGLSFSPDNSKLYLAVGRADLLQYEVESDDPTDIFRSELRIKPSNGLSPQICQMQIAPDGKIYLAQNGQSALAVINRPNEKGDDCEYRANGINLEDGVCRSGLPHYILSVVNQGAPVPGTPIANITKTRDGVCAGDVIDFGDIASVAEERWEWTFEGGIPDRSGLQIPGPVEYPAPGNYSVQLIAYNGCLSDTAYAEVRVEESPVVAAGSREVICLGEQVQLGTQADPRFTYRWSPPEGLSAADVPNPIASPLSTTEYTLLVGLGDCSSTATYVVNVVTPEIASAGSDTTICLGETAILRSGGELRYSWETEEGKAVGEGSEVRVSPRKSTSYIITAVDGRSCVNPDTMTVHVVESFDISLSIGKSFRRLVPGDQIVIPIAIHGPGGGDDIEFARVQSFNTALSYDMQALGYNVGSVRGLGDAASWNFNASENLLANKLTINASGPALKLGGDFCELTFTVYTTDSDSSFSPVVFKELRDNLEGSCVSNVDYEDGGVTLSDYCLRSRRGFSLSGIAYHLDHVLPNPSNGIVVIEFAVGASGPTRLEVFNSLGELVSVPIDAALQSGNFRTVLRDLPSGVYYYRLLSGPYSDTKTFSIVE